MRHTRSALRAVLIGLAWSVGAAPAAALTATYDQQVTTPDGMVMRATVAIKDERFRAETVVDGLRAIVLKNAEGTFNYLPDERSAIRLPSLESAQPGMESMQTYLETLRANQATPVGAETIGPYPCDIYEYAEPAGGGQTRAWVWKDREFPVKMELHGPDGLVLIELSNIALDAPVDDSRFELPAGTQIMDMGGMMQMMQNLPDTQP